MAGKQKKTARDIRVKKLGIIKLVKNGKLLKILFFKPEKLNFKNLSGVSRYSVIHFLKKKSECKDNCICENIALECSEQSHYCAICDMFFWRR
jgi:hypothetical protein